MLMALAKSKILTVRPVCQDKYDGGQFQFFQTIINRFPEHDIIYFAEKSDEGKMRQEAIPSQKVRDAIATGNLVVTGNDIYIAPNGFADDKGRQKDNVRHLNAFFTDIDFHKSKKYKNMKPEEVVASILQQCKSHNMPIPSLIICTGHGLHVWWLLAQPVDVRFMPVWDEIQTEIFQEFKAYGADAAAKDASRYLRIPGTNNNKDANEAREVAVVFVNPTRKYIKFDSMYRWAARHHEMVWLGRLRSRCESVPNDTPLHILKELVASEKIEVPNKLKFSPFIANEPVESIHVPAVRKANAARTHKTETEEECSKRHQVKAMSVNPMRLKDLQMLVKIRKGHMTGQRELFLHHYRNTLARCGFNGETQAAMIRAMNNQFTEPLPEYEVRSILKQYKLYMAKNETIIRDLSITAAEQAAMRTIIDTDEKERRRLQKNKCGVSNEERVKNTCAKIMQFLALGKTNSEIAALLHCTARTVRNYIHKFDLLGKGAAFCSEKIAETVPNDKPYQDTDENNRSVQMAASTYANEVVEKMKHKAGKKKRRIPKGLTKKEKAGLVSKILEVLEKQVPDFWKKLKDVADAFFKEKGAALLTYGENGKICYTPLFRSIILQSLPGFFSQKRPNGLVTAFFDALYAA